MPSSMRRSHCCRLPRPPCWRPCRRRRPAPGAFRGDACRGDAERRHPGWRFGYRRFEYPAGIGLAPMVWPAGVALVWAVVGWPEPLPATWVRLAEASLCIWISAACMAAASCWSRAAVVAAGADAVDDVEDEAGDEDGDAQAPEPAHALAALAPKLAAEVVLAEVAAAIALLSGGHANDNDERLMDMGVSPGGVRSSQQIPCRPVRSGRPRVPASWPDTSRRGGRNCRAGNALGTDPVVRRAAPCHRRRLPRRSAWVGPARPGL